MVFNEQMGYNIMISKIRSVNMDEIIEKVKEILIKNSSYGAVVALKYNYL